MLKVLDGDHGNSNVEYNRAAMDAGDLMVPTADGTSISFTICSASMVEAFTTGYSVQWLICSHCIEDQTSGDHIHVGCL